MRYEWDERKNRENQRKHRGISFELATLVFKDPRCLLELDQVDEAGEQRWHALGIARARPELETVLLVVHAYRHPSGEDLPPGTSGEDDYGEEIIRIISARRAGPNDLRRYREQAVV
jgi:uncharacterized DUF497 family protein